MLRFCVLGVVLTGCSTGPDWYSLGEFESPCSSPADCDSNQCLSVDGVGSCTTGCSGGGSCPQEYVCHPTNRVCAPDATASCRYEGDRCGGSFPPCCPGYGCAMFTDLGARCVLLGCRNDGDCYGSGDCCARVGADNACLPLLYCE